MQKEYKVKVEVRLAPGVVDDITLMGGSVVKGGSPRVAVNRSLNRIYRKSTMPTGDKMPKRIDRQLDPGQSLIVTVERLR